MDQALIIEWAPFTLRNGASEQRLMEASESLQRDFLDRQEGFLRRDLLKAEDGSWVDLVFWRSRADMDAAMKRVTESPVCHTYFSLMNEADSADPGAGVLHFQQRCSYAAPQRVPFESAVQAARRSA